MTADGRAAAVGVGTVRERDWLFDGHARIGRLSMTDPLPTNWIRRLGNTSVSTSAIIAGASPLGTMLSMYGYAVAEADAIDLVQQVLKSPIRAFDTSNAYSEGESERRIGLGIAAAGGVPQDFTVITKVDARAR